MLQGTTLIIRYGNNKLTKNNTSVFIDLKTNKEKSEAAINGDRGDGLAVNDADEVEGECTSYLFIMLDEFILMDRVLSINRRYGDGG